MTLFEIITTLVSVIALAISFVALVRARQISTRQLELEQVNANLASKQLSIIEAEEKRRAFPEIHVELVSRGAEYRFIVSNDGYSEARDVHFSFMGIGPPIPPHEFRSKTPILVLRPGKSLEFFAVREMHCDLKYRVTINWINPDGTNGRDEVTVSWQ